MLSHAPRAFPDRATHDPFPCETHSILERESVGSGGRIEVELWGKLFFLPLFFPLSPDRCSVSLSVGTKKNSPDTDLNLPLPPAPIPLLRPLRTNSRQWSAVSIMLVCLRRLWSRHTRMARPTRAVPPWRGRRPRLFSKHTPNSLGATKCTHHFLRPMTRCAASLMLAAG